MSENRIQPVTVATAKGNVPPMVAQGGWVPTPIAKHAISAAVACVNGVGMYLAAGGEVTWKGVASACFTAAGTYFAALFGIGSAGTRKV